MADREFCVEAARKATASLWVDLSASSALTLISSCSSHWQWQCGPCALLALSNMTVSTGTLNGLILFANVIRTNQSSFLAPESATLLRVFIAWLNLDLGISTCLYDGMDMYAKVWPFTCGYDGMNMYAKVWPQFTCGY